MRAQPISLKFFFVLSGLLYSSQMLLELYSYGTNKCLTQYNIQTDVESLFTSMYYLVGRRVGRNNKIPTYFPTGHRIWRYLLFVFFMCKDSTGVLTLLNVFFFKYIDCFFCYSDFYIVNNIYVFICLHWPDRLCTCRFRQHSLVGPAGWKTDHEFSDIYRFVIYYNSYPLRYIRKVMCYLMFTKQSKQKKKRKYLFKEPK